MSRVYDPLLRLRKLKLLLLDKGADRWDEEELRSACVDGGRTDGLGSAGVAGRTRCSVGPLQRARGRRKKKAVSRGSSIMMD